MAAPDARRPGRCPALQVGFMDDKVGPITLASIVLVTLCAITVMAFIDVFN